MQLDDRTVFARAAVDLRPLDPEDWTYVRSTWRETHHEAPGKRRMTWRDYKATHGKIIDDLLSRPDVSIVAAYSADRKIQGWIAWTADRISTLHYVFTRHDERQRGLASRLIREADLGTRFVYTHRGQRARKAGSVGMDSILVDALARRGVSAAYVPAAKWVG